MNRLLEAHELQNIDAIGGLEAELNAVWTAANEDLYKAIKDSAGNACQQHARNSDGNSPGADA